MKRLTLSLLPAVTILALAAPDAPAFIVSNVQYPPHVYRPDDGNWYSFPARITITLDAGDFAGGLIPVMYREYLFAINTTIDMRNLRIPAGLAAGTVLRTPANFNMFVGCDPGASIGINGPAGNTGQHPNDLADFLFPTLAGAGSYGSQGIHCLMGTGMPGDPFPDPYNEPMEDQAPDDPSPYPRGDLRPMDQYITYSDGTPAPTFDLQVVPTPGSIVPLAAAAAVVSLRRRRLRA
ncbi:MAG: hypothetical protein H7210_09525 [Pyrinomonadaceae bacterium]|nr:hypothetical protein [Phycisphaerales bacterium]